MDFYSEYLLTMVCRDSRDRVILDMLRAAGPAGLAPKQIHAKVHRYGLKYHHITRRIKRMNKRMAAEIGERVADKVGRNWALSSFILRNYGAKTDDVENKMGTLGFDELQL